MENNIRSSFEKIYAEEALKEKTAMFLKAEIKKRNKIDRTFKIKRFAVMCSSIVLFILLGGFSYNLYFSESSFIDIDVNPSIELTLNRFDRVINSYAYNKDGLDLLEKVEIRHKNYSEAIEILLHYMEQSGYLKQDSLLSITVQVNNGTKESNMLTDINKKVTTSIQAYNYNPEVNIFSVTEEVRNHAHENHVSPAKYLVITELQEVDPTITIESCREHSLTEIKQLIQNHHGDHHDNNSENNSIEAPKTYKNHNGHRKENGHHQ